MHLVPLVHSVLFNHHLPRLTHSLKSVHKKGVVSYETSTHGYGNYSGTSVNSKATVRLKVCSQVGVESSLTAPP